MSKSPVSRRGFVTAAGVAAAAAQSNAQTSAQTGSSASGQAARTPGTPIRVVTTYKFDPAEIAKIQGAVTNNSKVEIVIANDRDDFRRQLREAEVVYGGFNGPDLDYAPRLKWIQAGGAGVEYMDDKMRQSSILMTNYARTFAPGISETAIGLLLCLTRGITRLYAPQFAKRQWKAVGSAKSDDHIELAGKVMGIVGMGGIGCAVARRAHYGFDMKIVATDAKPMHPPEYVSELHDPGWFPKMVPMVDVLVSAAPSTAATRRMFNEQVFRSMKKTAYFLGMSRGDLFDDMALVKALKEGWIAGAGLDVFPQEPPPAEHPIFDCPNVVMTPHTSGWSPDRQIRLIELFAENMRRYSEGIPLINQVDKVKGY